MDDTELSLGKHFCHQVDALDYVFWAKNCVRKGGKSKSLLKPESMPLNCDVKECAKYFLQSLKELNLGIKNRTYYINSYIIFLVHQILIKEVPPFQGLGIILNIHNSRITGILDLSLFEELTLLQENQYKSTNPVFIDFFMKDMEKYTLKIVESFYKSHSS